MCVFRPAACVCYPFSVATIFTLFYFRYLSFSFSASFSLNLLLRSSSQSILCTYQCGLIIGLLHYESDRQVYTCLNLNA